MEENGLGLGFLDFEEKDESSSWDFLGIFVEILENFCEQYFVWISVGFSFSDFSFLGFLEIEIKVLKKEKERRKGID